jgi:hypothetical protein
VSRADSRARRGDARRGWFTCRRALNEAMAPVEARRQVASGGPGLPFLSRQVVAGRSCPRSACRQAEPRGQRPWALCRQVEWASSRHPPASWPAVAGLEALHPLAGKAQEHRQRSNRWPASVSPVHRGHGACRLAASALSDAASLAGNSPDTRARGRGIRGKSPTGPSTRLTIAAGPRLAADATTTSSGVNGAWRSVQTPGRQGRGSLSSLL